jgi:uncharacterized protein (TIGR04222 family)
MGQPWGLSGPQFLGIYAAAIVAVIIIVLLSRRAMRTVPGALPARELSPHEVGYLSGGPRRAAEVIIAELAGTGALRVDSRGRITETGPGIRSGQFADSFSRVWPQGMRPGGERTARVRDQLSADPRVRGIGADLRARSLLISQARLSRLRMVTAAAIAVLLIAGIARIIEGAGNHRPVSYLIMLVIGAAVVGVGLLRAACGGNQPTSLGARYLISRPWSAPQGSVAASLGQPGIPGFTAIPAVPGLAGPAGGYGRDTPWGILRSPAPETAAGGAALFAVALAGFSAVEDPGLRSALIAGMPTSGGSSSCGGSGCGGGGCGGGGCGG